RRSSLCPVMATGFASPRTWLPGQPAGPQAAWRATAVVLPQIRCPDCRASRRVERHVESRPQMAENDYRETFRAAGAPCLEGDPAAIADFEKGITKALEAGDMTAALSAHQRLLVWKPTDTDLHRRVAQQIASARDRAESGPKGDSAIARSPLFSGVPR